MYKQVAGSRSQVGTAKVGVPTTDLPPATPRVGPYELKLLAIGIAGGLLAHAFWLLGIPFKTLQTLFHELGHAIVAWLLGHAAIPAFDFLFGGGFTNYGEFHLPIALAAAGLFAYLGWKLRQNPAAVAVIAAMFVVWLICVSSAWRRETVIASAGVAFELIFAAIFLYMALAGVGWKLPQVERPLAAVAAFYIQFDSWMFAMRLMRDPDFLAWYKEGKGGALMNDLELVALNLKIYLGWNTTVESVAKMLFLFSFLPMAVAVWCYLRPEKVQRVIDSLLAY